MDSFSTRIFPPDFHAVHLNWTNQELGKGKNTSYSVASRSKFLCLCCVWWSVFIINANIESETFALVSQIFSEKWKGKIFINQSIRLELKSSVLLPTSQWFGNWLHWEALSRSMHQTYKDKGFSDGFFRRCLGDLRANRGDVERVFRNSACLSHNFVILRPFAVRQRRVGRWRCSL